VENELREALEKDEFVLYYQPQLCCRTGALKGVEALIRWDHPEKGILGPGAFIEVAEETGLIVDIGDWVMHTACVQAKTWFDAGRRVRVAINVSTLQFERPDFIRRVLRAMEDTGATPEMIELELTESLAMSDVKAVVDRMEPLRAIGIRFAIDDFGSGYSSLGYLSKLNFDCFKIDRSFIQNIGKSSADDALVRTILGMARSLGYETVAEGIETMEQYAFLRNEGCEIAQGFLFARPMPIEDVELWQDRRQQNMARSLQSSLEKRISGGLRKA
jgi:EAL domain-containing protein (putative c-di-GMP-specific phosphodiesterase class I)